MTQISHMEIGWLTFVHAVGIHDAPPEQLREMRRAFYAGAALFFEATMNALEPDNDGNNEPTQAEVARFDAIVEELRTFGRLVAEGQA